jgi:hypothetical protein
MGFATERGAPRLTLTVANVLVAVFGGLAACLFGWASTRWLLGA